MISINSLIRPRTALVGAVTAMVMAGGIFATGPAAAANLDGVWQLASPQASLKPADGKAISFTKDGQGLYESNVKAAASHDLSFDLTETRCSSPGTPRIMLSPMPMRIFQRPGMISILFQWNHLTRQLDLDPPPKQVDAAPSFMGSSFAHWAGDTLVVKTNYFLPQSLLDNLIPSSEDLALMERMRLRDSNTLEDRITISDPQMFTRPWDVVLVYKRAPDDLFPFREDVCLDRIKAGLPLPR